MAGDWTAIEHATIVKSEIRRLATLSARSKHEVLGLMLHFWVWAEQQTTDGIILTTLDELPEEIGADSDFWKAVVRVGWLEVIDQEKIKVPRADHWLTRGAKARLTKSRRQALNRAGSGGDGPPSTTEENRTEETPKGSLSELNTDPVPLPPPNGFDGHRGGRSESVFDGITAEMLHDRYKLREWFRTQGKAKRPVLNPKNPDDWILCLAAALHAKHEGKNPAAMFASLVGGKNGRTRIKQKHWDRASEVARDFPGVAA